MRWSSKLNSFVIHLSVHESYSSILHIFDMIRTNTVGLVCFRANKYNGNLWVSLVAAPRRHLVAVIIECSSLERFCRLQFCMASTKTKGTCSKKKPVAVATKEEPDGILDIYKHYGPNTESPPVPTKEPDGILDIYKHYGPNTESPPVPLNQSDCPKQSQHEVSKASSGSGSVNITINANVDSI